MSETIARQTTTKSGTIIGAIAVLHGLGSLLLRPFLFYIAPYEVTKTLGIVFFVLLSVTFIASGIYAILGRRQAFLAIGIACFFASFQYISPEFAYSFMGPLFFKVGSSVMSPQPWVNINLFAFILCFFASRKHQELKQSATAGPQG